MAPSFLQREKEVIKLPYFSNGTNAATSWPGEARYLHSMHEERSAVSSAKKLHDW